MKYYAVIDTNVLVSAMIKWNSVPGNIMELTFDGSIVPILNEQIVKEYREVLTRPKFHFTKEIFCLKYVFAMQSLCVRRKTFLVILCSLSVFHSSLF